MSGVAGVFAVSSACYKRKLDSGWRCYTISDNDRLQWSNKAEKLTHELAEVKKNFELYKNKMQEPERQIEALQTINLQWLESARADERIIDYLTGLLKENNIPFKI